MATVRIRVQSTEKCLVSWTIFQMEDHSLSLSELFENIKMVEFLLLYRHPNSVRHS